MRPDQVVDAQMVPSSAPDSRRGQLLTSLGAVAAAFLASLCCAGPILFVTLGVGAGLASRFEPLRPIFTALTLVLLAVGFYTVYGRKPAAAAAPSSTGDHCTLPTHHRRLDRAVFWGATIIALLVLTFPRWSLFFV